MTNLMRSPTSANAGSKPDDDYNILEPADTNEALALLNVEEEWSSLETDSSSSSSNSTVHSHDNATFEKCSVVYFAGYLIKKCLVFYKIMIKNMRVVWKTQQIYFKTSPWKEITKRLQ